MIQMNLARNCINCFKQRKLLQLIKLKVFHSLPSARMTSPRICVLSWTTVKSLLDDQECQWGQAAIVKFFKAVACSQCRQSHGIQEDLVIRTKRLTLKRFCLVLKHLREPHCKSQLLGWESQVTKGPCWSSHSNQCGIKASNNYLSSSQILEETKLGPDINSRNKEEQFRQSFHQNLMEFKGCWMVLC